MTDVELVRECLSGRTDSYRELMDRYRDSAMAVAVNILANREDAEDACQEAFLKAFRHLDAFDAGRSYKNWFYALLSNHCLDMIRKRSRFKGFLGRFRYETPVVSPDAEGSRAEGRGAGLPVPPAARAEGADGPLPLGPGRLYGGRDRRRPGMPAQYRHGASAPCQGQAQDAVEGEER